MLLFSFFFFLKNAISLETAKAASAAVCFQGGKNTFLRACCFVFERKGRGKKVERVDERGSRRGTAARRGEVLSPFST